jgi:hypothetical protein
MDAPMIAPLSLSNLITVVLAVICLSTILPQARGNVVKIWRLAMPACLGMVVAFILLAGVFNADLVTDAEWLAALLVGGVAGRLRGWTAAIEVDQASSLMRQRRSADGTIAATGLVLVAMFDFASAAFRDIWIEPEHVAAAAALFAGFLGCRALAIAVRTTRLPHHELHVA